MAFDHKASLDFDLTGTQVEAPTRQLTLPLIFISTFKTGDATPTVKNLTRLKAGNSGATITDFLKGQEGQEIQILGDDNTIIQDYSNGSKIITLGAADFTMASRTVYKFTLWEGLWLQH